MRLVTHLLALLAPVQIIIALPAIGLVQRNIESMGLDPSMVLPLAWIAGAMLAIGLVGAFLSEKHGSGRYTYTFVLLLAPAWIAYSPASVWVGRDVAFWGLVSVIAFVAIAFARRPSWHRNLTQVSAAAAIALAGLVAYEVYDLTQLARTDPQSDTNVEAGVESPPDLASANRPDAPDVYHLVFDEFQTEMFQAAVTSEHEASLGGFTFFPYASTPYGRTDMALGATFSGRSYPYSGEPYEYIFAAFHGEHSLLTRLKDRGYRTYGLLYQIYPARSESAFDWTVIQKKYADFSGQSDLGRLLYSVWVFAHFPPTIASWLLDPDRVDQLEAQTLLPRSNSFRSVLALRRFIRDGDPWRSSGPKYVYIHMFVPHFPLELDEHCELKDADSVSAELQTTCALKLIGEFVDALKREGRFENSLIVVHGDHGARYSLVESRLKRWLSKDPQYSDGRSRPLLLAKPAGVGDDEPFRVDPRRTDLYDIYPTIIEGAGMEAGDTVGHSLFKEDPPSRTRYYHFYRKHKDYRQVMDGDLRRYLVTDDGVEFDQRVPITR